MIPNIAEEWKNYKAVLQCIEKSETHSRASLAKQLDLSRTTTSLIGSYLISQGLVEEQETAINGRGRPGIPLKLDRKCWFALGAAFQNSEWVFVMTDLAGSIVAEHREQLHEITVPVFCEHLYKGLEYMIARCPGKLLPLIGVGTPGLVNTATGTILRADDLGWKDIPLGKTILQKTGFPAMITNRYLCGGLAEARFGAGKDVENLLYIGISTGIRAAIIYNGELLNGAGFSAGEIGHMLIDPQGPVCGCGRKGCLQAMTSAATLVRTAKEKFGREETASHICIQAELGDDDFRDCIREIALPLGTAIGNLINALNPQKIIIGGTLGRSSALLTQLAAKEAFNHAIYPLETAGNIVQSELGDLAETIGAASLPLQYKSELVIGKEIP